MSMLITCMIATEWLAGGSSLSNEIVRTAAGELITYTATGTPYGDQRLTILVPGMLDDEVFFYWDGRDARIDRTEADSRRLGGPVSWGCVDGHTYSVSHARPDLPLEDPQILPGNHTQIMAHVIPNWEVIAGERMNWEGEQSQIFIERIRAVQSRYGWACTPLRNYVDEHRDLFLEWDLYFDFAFPAIEHIACIAVRDGRMMVWELHETGNIEAVWTAHEPFATEIEGPFRILRAEENLYLVDEGGHIYTSLGAEHRRIGTIEGWEQAPEGALNLLFEDQATDKIGFIQARTDRSAVVLPIKWDVEGHAADFMTVIESDDLRDDLLQIADILREDLPDNPD